MLFPPVQGPEAEGHLAFKKQHSNWRLGLPSLGAGGCSPAACPAVLAGQSPSFLWQHPAHILPSAFFFWLLSGFHT